MAKQLMVTTGRVRWCTDYHAEAIQRYAPCDWEVRIVRGEQLKFADWKRSDIVFSLTVHGKERLSSFKRKHPATFYIGRFNTQSPPRGKRLRWFCQRADLCVCENAQTYEHEKERHKNLRLLLAGVDMSIYKPIVDPANRPRRVLWIGTCKGLFGGKAKIKRPELAVEVQSLLKPRGIDMEIVRSDPLGKDKMNQSQMVEWYNRGCVFLITSCYEGGPSTGNESAACGCAVVSTRVGTMPELIEDGINGYLVSDDPQEMADACEKSVLQWDSMTDNIMERIARRHWPVVTPSYYRLLDAVMETKP